MSVGVIDKHSFPCKRSFGLNDDAPEEGVILLRQNLRRNLLKLGGKEIYTETKEPQKSLRTGTEWERLGAVGMCLGPDCF